MPAVSTKTPQVQAQEAYEKASKAKSSLGSATERKVKADTAFATKVRVLDETGVETLKKGIAAYHKAQDSTVSATVVTQDLIEVE